MAGIAGIVYPDIFQMGDLIHPMLEMLKHRGPLQQEIYQHKNIQLGICGNVLARDKKTTIIVLLDGNIYNKEALCRELQQKITLSSAQLVAHAYLTWGEEFAAKLDGDFSIAILDQRKNLLLLLRDYIGNKPLYWYHDRHHFIFASEIKSLLATGVIPQTPAADGIAAYFSMGYIPQDMTPIQNVNKLLPGYYLRYVINGCVSIHSYWSYSSYFEKTNGHEAKTFAKKLDQLLISSTKMRLPTEGKIGSFVSGGLGSASVAHYLSTLYPQTETTAYSVGFKGQNDPDITAASIISQNLKLQHEVDWITPDNWLDDFVKIVWHLDEPLADFNAIATWKMAQLASKDSHVVFSGMGSDELLAGHTRYTIKERRAPFMNWFAQASHPFIQYLISPILQWINRRSVYTLLKESRTNPWHSGYLQKNALFNASTLSLACPELAGLFDPDIFLNKFHNLPRIKSTVSSFLYFDIKTRLPDCYILQYERFTSAHGLDWKSPFLDKAIVEYMAGFVEPEDLEEEETASVLKLILKDVFPSTFINRPKKTRTDLLKPWISSSPLPAIFKQLASGTLVETGFVSESWLRNQIATPEQQQKSFPMLWAILSLEVWFRLNINRPLLSPPSSLSLLELLSEYK